VANVQHKGRVWQIFNKRDVGNGKCLIGGTWVINVQQGERVWQMFKKGTWVVNVQNEGRV